MAKLNWEIIHECDDDQRNPTEWAAEIRNPKYGRFCWIDDMGGYFSISTSSNGGKELVRCKSFTSAKRWVARYLAKK